MGFAIQDFNRKTREANAKTAKQGVRMCNALRHQPYFNGLTLSNCRVGCKPGLGANVQQAVSKNT
jgi:hypothetical protein